MARDTLPRGSSLLALAGSTAIARPAEELPEPPRPTSAPSSSSAAAPPRQRDKALPRRQIAPKPGRHDARPMEPAAELAVSVERRQKINARIPPALAEAVRDCVVHLSGPPHGMTMDGFAEEAYRRELERLKRAHHDGEAFPSRPYNPKPGRRIR